MDNQGLRLSAILSIDVPELGLSGLGEEESGLLEACRRIVGEATAVRGGNLVKAIGDSFIITFDNCQDAVGCALDISARLSAEAGSKKADASPLRARMGVHLGDLRFFEKNIFGDAVDVAAALQAAARPGSICISGEVLSLVREKMALSVLPLSEQRHKALPAGIKAYEISAEVPGSGPALGEIRKAILEEIKVQGRRLTVDEARRKFGWYGVEAAEVIASLAEAGILIGNESASASRSADRYGPDARERDKPPGAAGYASADVAGDIGRSIESAIYSIVSEIEKAARSSVRRDSSRRDGGSGDSGIHIRIDKDSFAESARDLREVGREIKRQFGQSRSSERRAGKHPGRRRSSRAEMGLSTTAFEKYRTDLAAKADKQKKGLAGSVISFIVINAGLWYLNMNFAQGFAWAPIVSIFWGFGVLDSIFSAGRLSRQARETDALPNLDETQTKELKTIHKERNSIGSHFLSTLSISSGLFAINMATEGADPWHLIPIAVLSTIFLIHLATYIATAPGRARRFFAKLGIRRDKKSLQEARKRRETTTTELGAYADLYGEAQDSAADIESALSSTDPKASAEMKPQLDGYLNQVLLLAKTANELDDIIAEIPMEALQRDKAALKTKLKGAAETMKSEYEESIREVEKQEESFKALAEQREVIDLRLRSSINQLHQLKMDLARAKAADTESDTGRSESALSSVRARSEELSHYIDDLKRGHLEALADPFLELEKKYGSADLQPDKGADPR